MNALKRYLTHWNTEVTPPHRAFSSMDRYSYLPEPEIAPDEVEE
jgi:hypothetical protein